MHHSCPLALAPTKPGEGFLGGIQPEWYTFPSIPESSKNIFLVPPFKLKPQWPWELAKQDTFQEEHLHNKICKRRKKRGEVLKHGNSRHEPKI